MSPLEDMWSNYPTGEPPRLAPPVARRSRRGPLLVAAATVAVAAGATGIVAVNQGGGTAPINAEFRYAAFKADLKPATSCNQLLTAYRDRGATLVSAWGWNGGVQRYAIDDTFAAGAMPMGGRAPTLNADLIKGIAPQSSTLNQANSATGTNVQEIGVDEPDQVKTDGTVLARITDSTIALFDVSGSKVQRKGTVALPYFTNGQILLAGSTLIAIGADTQPSPQQVSGARVDAIDISNPDAPRITSSATYANSAITSARQHGSTIRLVLSTGLPNLPFIQPQGATTEKAALAHNKALVAKSTLAQWLPSYAATGSSTPLVTCENVAIPPATVPLGTTSVVGFDAATPTALSSIGVLGTTGTAYESATHLYLTTTGFQGGCLDVCPMMGGVMRPCCFWGNQGPTTIFQFDLNGVRATHVATGTVQGTIADRWSMDEAGGVLRVATTSATHGRGPQQTSSVLTLHPNGTKLITLGRIDDLGVGETLTAARWFDDLAIVSTAAQIDPLYTIDLKDPAHPKLLGSLHIPGYSKYFHPIGSNQIFAVGQDVSFNKLGEQSRAQVGVFDIKDLAHVRRVSSYSLGQWSQPMAGSDPRTFTWLPDRATALTVFSNVNNHNVLGTFKVNGSTLTTKVIAVPSADPYAVRTMELPDHRVVLIAGGDVSFLNL